MSELELYKGMLKKMKDDEIKEFNEELYVEMLENGELYDYITNLQQEKEDYKSRCEKANKELINSKEYQMAIAMELNAKQSILIKLDNILNGRSDE